MRILDPHFLSPRIRIRILGYKFKEKSSGVDASPKQKMINAIDHALEILEQNKPKIKQEKDLREAILKYIRKIYEILLCCM